MNRPDVTAFFDEDTFTVSYVVTDPQTSRACIIDPVLDFDAASGRTATRSADAVLDFVKSKQLSIDWILETHVHADHLSSAAYLKQLVDAPVAIGASIGTVQESFATLFNLKTLPTDGSQFDRLFENDSEFEVGSIKAKVMATPGHTPACVCYVIGDAAFVGDTLFMPDFGTARTDFPGGSAAHLYDSIRSILALPGATRLFMCHDYKAPGRDEFAWETTVDEQRASNIHIHDGVSREDFIEMREGRDSQLGMPKLILPSIQVNIRAGALPNAEDNNIRYLKIPLDAV